MNKLDLDTALDLYSRTASSEAAALHFDPLTTDAEQTRAKAALIRLGVFLPDLTIPAAQVNRRGVMVTPLADEWKQNEDQTLAQLKAKLVQALLGAQ